MHSLWFGSVVENSGECGERIGFDPILWIGKDYRQLAMFKNQVRYSLLANSIYLIGQQPVLISYFIACVVC